MPSRELGIGTETTGDVQSAYTGHGAAGRAGTDAIAGRMAQTGRGATHGYLLGDEGSLGSLPSHAVAADPTAGVPRQH
jgi:hypothetical protein